MALDSLIRLVQGPLAPAVEYSRITFETPTDEVLFQVTTSLVPALTTYPSSGEVRLKLAAIWNRLDVLLAFTLDTSSTLTKKLLATAKVLGMAHEYV